VDTCREMVGLLFQNRLRRQQTLDPRLSGATNASACESDQELITEAIRPGRNAMAICGHLIDDHGFTA